MYKCIHTYNKYIYNILIHKCYCFPPPHNIPPPQGGRENLSLSTLTIFCHHLLHPVPPSTQHTPTTGGRENLSFSTLTIFCHLLLYTSCSPFHTTYPHHRGGGGYHDHWGGEGGVGGAGAYIYNICISRLHTKYPSWVRTT